MKNSKKEIFTALNSISHLGLSVVISFLLWIAIASWVKKTFNLGDYVMIIGIFLGLGSASLTFLKFCKVIVPKEKQDEK